MPLPCSALFNNTPMQKWIDIIANSYQGYAQYLWHEILHPSWNNYFYWLIGLSLVCWSLELLFPWRKNQAALRCDFWLDGFYMFFNFFFFSLIGFSALSNIGVELFQSLLRSCHIDNPIIIPLQNLPTGYRMIILFLISDFIQWNTHRMLHRIPWLWEFHKVHHSVREMGFAAHLRYHWMENIIYKTILFIPLSLIGFGLMELFGMHILAVAIGHLNHSNIPLTWGPFKYILNSPAMHIWHHAHHLPKGLYGVNYGISLSLWDYIFGTAHLPHDGRDIALGFDGVENYPHSFLQQSFQPFKKKSRPNC
jgi:sterol desaturase/sphingolipid hydroxylase (fatty acid hydroxylase superfamily)